MNHGPFSHPTRPSEKIGPFPILTESERAALVEEVLAGAADLDEFWVFAYGSLIWNPCFEPTHQYVATVDGLSRSFSFWTVISRGSPDFPGLGMGVVESDARCTGVIQRIDPKSRDSDLEALWKREMHSSVYRPTWVEAQVRDHTTKAGSPGRSIRALTFVSNRSHPQSAHGLTREEEIEIILSAGGKFGRCAEYLFRMTETLEQLGVVDPAMQALKNQVLAAAPPSKGRG